MSHARIGGLNGNAGRLRGGWSWCDGPCFRGHLVPRDRCDLCDHRQATRSRGHWNDAYPYVALHQPGSTYGVASRQLGSGRIDDTGYNLGLEALASGPEVVSHFHQLMRDTLLPSGRVSYFPMHEYVGDGEFVSILSGDRHRVEASTVVDATLLETRIPLTHRREFPVAGGVACSPPNDLPRMAPAYERFTVLGVGKTGLDAVLWLLSNGTPPERISWVVPRDPWMINRAMAQGGPGGFVQSAGLVALQLEAAAQATSLDNLGERFEQAGVWFRLSPQFRPAMQHCGSITAAELADARRVDDVIRLGRVTSIDDQTLTLERGARPVLPGTLFIDCTARALEKNVGVARPVFEPGRIYLQMIRICQPTFSAALIGHIEATVADPDEKLRLATPIAMPDSVADWVRATIETFNNARTWGGNGDLRIWLDNCRLNATAGWSWISADNVEGRALSARIAASIGPALKNLHRLTAEA